MAVSSCWSNSWMLTCFQSTSHMVLKRNIQKWGLSVSSTACILTTEKGIWYNFYPDLSVRHQVKVAAKSLQSCPTLCDPIDGSPTGSPVPRILQARTLEWVAISFSNAWKWKVKGKSLSHVRLFATLWTAAYVGSSIRGIFQARVLEWGAIAFSAFQV